MVSPRGQKYQGNKKDSTKVKKGGEQKLKHWKKIGSGNWDFMLGEEETGRERAKEVKQQLLAGRGGNEAWLPQM